jgi:structural maintenance of chromosome 2
MKKEIDILKLQLNELEKTLSEINKELGDDVDKLKRLESTVGKAREKLKEMVAEYAWIEAEKKFFGKLDSPYCFKDVNDSILENLLKNLEDQRDDLKKRINPKVEDLFENNSKRHEELIRKRMIIQ